MAETTAADRPVDGHPPTGRRGLLSAVLLFTMTASSFQIFAIAVLAVDIIDDLGMSRTALGLLGSLNTLVGALTAPTMGRLTDRIGAGRAAVMAITLAGIGMALMALSHNWVLLALSALISGVPQGWGNPATNALIAERVPTRARGTVTGIKQSGVQFGIFLSGFSLPGLALWLGWRGALWGFAAAFFVGAGLVAIGLGAAPVIEPSAGVSDRGPGRRAALPGFIWALTVYAFLYGTAGGAVGRFFPLWANEVVGLSTVRAGALVALSGLLGIAARIGAGRLAQDRVGPANLLSVLAGIGSGYCAILLATVTIGSWVLWPAAVLYSVGIGAWNSVAMLAIIVSVPRNIAGRASGVVMLGFLGGLTLGSPLAGAAVDRWDTYQPVWLAALALSLVSAVLIQPRFSRTSHIAVAP